MSGAAPSPRGNTILQTMDEPDTVVVRATVNLPGLRVGSVVRVDSADPYIAGLIAATYLVPVEEE